ncbi:MAG TPA: cytochrome b/b6 domain-containing protein [Woeseiaceae bacterium]|nr:cytochrome b/b6 domain-containing protein [Woeseiaceae bacterium]
MDRPESVPVWDPVVRTLHWSLAAIVVVDYWATDPGSSLHNWLGYAAMAIVAVRLVWGFAGRGYARFSSFTPSRTRFREHWAALRSRAVPAESGHNPLGALMIYAVMVLVTALAVTGFLHEEIDALFGNAFLQDVHELAAHALWICAIVHVLSVFAVQYYGRVELVRPMITGRRRR